MKRIIRYISIILIIINCIIIFNFSSEKSTQSDETSGRLINILIELNPKTKNLTNNEKEEIKANIVKPIRKIAHFTIFASLGGLIYVCLQTFEIKDSKRVVISEFLAFIYACTDEIHQLFVSGRSGQILDVLIDSGGSMFGILIVYIVVVVYKKIKK